MTCTVEGCDTAAYARRLCRKHYMRVRKYGSTDVPSPAIESLPGEEWRPVLGREGEYEVSNLGRVKSLPREVQYPNGHWRAFPGGLLAQAQDELGRCSVSFKLNGAIQNARVHRLVLEAFVGPAPEGTEACHWDDNASNNNLANLRWDTHEENMLDRVRNNALNPRTHCDKGHEFTEDNLYWDKRGGRRCKQCTKDKAMKNYWERKMKEAA